jgi:hypothetical protein
LRGAELQAFLRLYGGELGVNVGVASRFSRPANRYLRRQYFDPLGATSRYKAPAVELAERLAARVRIPDQDIGNRHVGASLSENTQMPHFSLPSILFSGRPRTPIFLRNAYFLATLVAVPDHPWTSLEVDIGGSGGA